MKDHFRWYLILPLLAVFFSGCAGTGDYLPASVYASENSSPAENSDPKDVSADRTEDPSPAPSEVGECIVHIGGAVVSPGVYHVRAGSRLIDAVELAGGLTTEASPDGCNLAEVLIDGMYYRIPTAEETSLTGTAPVQAPSSYTADGRLDINLASPEELMNLSGIGKTRADAIVAYREEHGRFQAPEDIKQVSGIGEAVYAAISGEITVR